MGQTEGQLKSIAATQTQATHQQHQQGMQPLFRLAQVTNPQQLQGPFVHRIHPQLFAADAIAAKSEGRQSLDTRSITAQTISPKTITGLQKKPRSCPRFPRRGSTRGRPLQHLQHSGLIAAGRIQQNRLLARHRQGSNSVVRQKTESRSRHGLTRMRFVRNSIGIGSIMQVIRNKSLNLLLFSQ